MSPPAVSGSTPGRSRRPIRRRSREASPEWLVGFHPVQEALRARRRTLHRLWLREGGRRGEQASLVGLAEAAGIPIEVVARSVFETRVDAELPAQGVALEAGPIPELALEALLGASSREDEEGGRPGRVIVALDGVEDPQNLGAVARVAESAGAEGLLLTERRAPPLSPAVSRASAGAIEWLPVARVGNLARALTAAQQAGFWIVAAEPEGGELLYSVADRVLTGPLVVVLGAEGKGLRPIISKLADHRVALPMRGRVASLNVSTAGAVLLYDLIRRAEIPSGHPAGE